MDEVLFQAIMEAEGDNQSTDYTQNNDDKEEQGTDYTQGADDPPANDNANNNEPANTNGQNQDQGGADNEPIEPDANAGGDDAEDQGNDYSAGADDMGGGYGGGYGGGSNPEPPANLDPKGKSQEEIKALDGRVQVYHLLEDFTSLYRSVNIYIKKISSFSKDNLLYTVTRNQVVKNFEKLSIVLYKYITYYYDSMSYDYNLYTYNYLVQCCKVNIELLKKADNTSLN